MLAITLQVFWRHPGIQSLCPERAVVLLKETLPG